MQSTIQDFKYELRFLRTNRGLATVILLTLVVGIATDTTIFSVVSSILLRKPPVRDPDRIAIVLSTQRDAGLSDSPEHPVAAPDVLSWRQQNRTFEELAAFEPWREFALSGPTEPQYASGTRVSSNYFSVLGVSPEIGRTFVSGEDEPGHDDVVILSHSLWEKLFSSDPRVLGRTLTVDGRQRNIVGVMPADFKLWIFPAQLWTPLVPDKAQLAPAGRKNRFLYVLGRLGTHVGLQQAQADLAAISSQLAQTYQEDKGWGVTLMTLQDFQIEDAHSLPAIVMLMMAAGFVLLIACANVAGLLLARSVIRQPEIGIRIALGASRIRLLRQLLSENFLIAIIASAFSLVVSIAGTKGMQKLLNFNDVVRAVGISVDWRVVSFAAILSVISVLIFGLVPALHSTSPQVYSKVTQSGRGQASERLRGGIRRLFVSSQIAMSIVLLCGAVLMVKYFVDEMNADLGFNSHKLLTAHISLPSWSYPTEVEQASYSDRLVDSLAHLPGVESATASTSLPAAGQAPNAYITIEGQPSSPENAPRQAQYYAVFPDYFHTLEIPVLGGRGFTKSDRSGLSPVALVNKTFARRFLSEQNAIGQRIMISLDQANQNKWYQIVGIVGDVKDSTNQPADPQVYVPYLQVPSENLRLVLRTRPDPSSMASALRRTVWNIDKSQAINELMPMVDLLATTGGAGGLRLMGGLLGVLAILALILSAIGIYGMASYTAKSRTQEFGIRLAMGAGSTDILWLLMREAIKVVGFGVAVGSVCAFLMPILLHSIFWQFSMQSTTLLLVVAISSIASIALLSSYIPATRVTGLNPVAVLRYQ